MKKVSTIFFVLILIISGLIAGIAHGLSEDEEVGGVEDEHEESQEVFLEEIETPDLDNIKGWEPDISPSEESSLGATHDAFAVSLQ